MTGKKKDLVQYGIGLVVILVINWIASGSFLRIDLTEDKRYSLAESTKDIVSSLDNRVDIVVYLHGNFPAGFKNLERAIDETLAEMAIYSGNNLHYRFVDPYQKEKDKKKRGEFFQKLAQLGLQPTTVVSNRDGIDQKTLVFPGAIITYKGKQIAVPFLKGNREQDLYQSIETVEFEVISALKVVSQDKIKQIAFIEGHGELNDMQVYQAMSALSLQYNVGRLNLSAPAKIGEDIAAVIIAQPKRSYTEAEKYKLDQYVMNGGKLLFFLDAIETRKDSVGLQGLPYDLNLRDLLFRYGVRVNMNMIQDLNASPVPIRDGENYKLLPWPFYPLLNEFNKKHPIVKNMNALLTRHINTLDTIKAVGIKKTPLVFTSKYTKVKSQPIVYSAEELRINLDKNYYTSGQLPVSYLLEGKFTSLYKARPTPQGISSKVANEFKSQGSEGKVFVFSDGDLLVNAFDQKAKKPYPLGFDQYTREVYSNKQFLLNTINYMLDEHVVRQSFTKNIVKRPLDAFKVKEEKTKWQIINVALPILLVIIFGLIRWFIRKRTYANF